MPNPLPACRPLAAAGLALLLGAAGPVGHRPSHAAAPAAAPAAAAGTPVPLSAQPRTWMDTAARRLTAQDIGEARRAGDVPLVLVGSAKLGGPTDRPALFVQLQSPRDCGSAGCDTQVFLWRNGAWARVLDGVSGKLAVARTRTRGFADLLTDSDRYTWTGSNYRSTHPAPAVDLRPKR